MKILFATRGIFPYFYGGACRYCYFLIKYLSNFPCEIYIIYPIDKEHPEKRTFFSDMSNCYEFHLPKGRNIYTYSMNIARFVKCRKFNIAYSDELALSMLTFVKDRGYPIVMNRHGYHYWQTQAYSDYLKWDTLNALKEIALLLPRRTLDIYFTRKFDYLISLGTGITRILTEKIGVSTDKTFFIPNGVNIEFIKDRETERDKIENSLLYVGSIQHRKGLRTLLKAYDYLSKPPHLYIVGKRAFPGKDLKPSRKENITFLGRISDVELKEWYQKVEVLIVPSYSEGLPTVILEAMANKLPVIATDVGAISDVVTSNNGFLTKPGDPVSLARAIESFCSLSCTEKAEMGECSYHIVKQNYTWEKVARKMFDLFCYLIGK